jgi:hypothetical protein
MKDPPQPGGPWQAGAVGLCFRAECMQFSFYSKQKLRVLKPLTPICMPNFNAKVPESQ